jgi:hypothetical protein
MAIQNGKNKPLSAQSGNLPQMGSALQGWFQPMNFVLVVKSTVAYQAYEVGESFTYRGVIQPLQNKDLVLKPLGQQAWSWFMLHSDPGLTLNVDEVVTYQNVQYRVMGTKDYSIYNYRYYELIQDYTNSGPKLVDSEVWDGGAPDTEFENELSGGEPDTEFGLILDGGSP